MVSQAGHGPTWFHRRRDGRRPPTTKHLLPCQRSLSPYRLLISIRACPQRRWPGSEEKKHALKCSPEEVGACYDDPDPEVPGGLVHDGFVFDARGAFEAFAAVRASAVSTD